MKECKEILRILLMLEILLEQYMSKIYQCIYLYIYGKASRYNKIKTDGRSVVEMKGEKE